ncbi:MAG: hydantoinase/oxoprolinase family protein [Acidobacteria bacterium]|nr:hydantoinase/oxoprolinase family protein [Acidobacteriota bacterium]
MHLRIGVDTGGTFTDFVCQASGTTRHLKVRSTPHDPSEAVAAGVEAMLEGIDFGELEVVHGSTVATNALIERRGARTALITTEGFEDLIEIGRQARPDLYDLRPKRAAPLVGRDLRFGVAERVDSAGAVLRHLTAQEIKRVIGRLTRKGPESVAICLLFSFLNPGHERRLERAVRQAGFPVSASSSILPEYREFERASTVVVNAYLLPLMSDYLLRLSERVKRFHARRKGKAGTAVRHPLRVMQSSGGSISASQAAREPVRVVLSGPAGGVVGAQWLAGRLDLPRIITFDMGGTSTDVALSDGATRTTREMTVAVLPIAVPVIDIHTVGAGGGSIATIDGGGALRVGPRSAGADPGPACYGRGEELTVTDANLVLGRFGGDHLLGGDLKLDSSRANRLMERFARKLFTRSQGRLKLTDGALGILRVVNANMEQALRVISVERGHDPRLFTLVSFGGAGGLHVCELSRALRIPEIVIPESPGTLSARGMLLADVVQDLTRTAIIPAQSGYRNAVIRVFRELEATGRGTLRREGFPSARRRFVRSCAMRFRGQSFEMDIPWVADVRAAFLKAHRQRYGHADPDWPCEIVSVRVRAIGLTGKPAVPRSRSARVGRPRAASTARAFFAPRPTEIPIFDRETLRPGDRVPGPSIIREYSSTTVVLEGFQSVVDSFSNLILSQL